MYFFDLKIKSGTESKSDREKYWVRKSEREKERKCGSERKKGKEKKMHRIFILK